MRLILLVFVYSFVNSLFVACIQIFDNYIPGEGIVHLAFPCDGFPGLYVLYYTGRSPEEENEYKFCMDKDIQKFSKITLKFDSETTVRLVKQGFARITTGTEENEFNIVFYKMHTTSTSCFPLSIQGAVTGIVPYLTSIKIDNETFCNISGTGYFDKYLKGFQNQATSQRKRIDTSCGRRKVSHTELIVNGAPTKPGDWAWHVAINRLEKTLFKYIGGGTLISKSFVLTAAHCVTIRGVTVVPNILSIVLAKYNLLGGDVASQEREISNIIVHNDFRYRFLDNDIALLQLRTVAVYNDYIQPACLWHNDVVNRISTSDVLGTVVGWGFNHTDSLSEKLLQATMPVIPDITCIKKNPVFYSNMLNGFKFCAGLGNGTSPCNGDSGGGFVVFVPDAERDSSLTASGAWYVRGIVSVAISKTDAPVCDPEQYVVLTDVAQYKTWIENYIKDDVH